MPENISLRIGRLEWRLGDSFGISNRGTGAKSITSCDNTSVTNIGAAAASLALRFRAKNICWPETLERASRVKRLIGRPQESAQSERKSTPHFAEEPY